MDWVGVYLMVLSLSVSQTHTHTHTHTYTHTHTHTHTYTYTNTHLHFMGCLTTSKRAKGTGTTLVSPYLVIRWCERQQLHCRNLILLINTHTVTATSRELKNTHFSVQHKMLSGENFTGKTADAHFPQEESDPTECMLPLTFNYGVVSKM